MAGGVYKTLWLQHDMEAVVRMRLFVLLVAAPAVRVMAGVTGGVVAGAAISQRVPGGFL